MDARDDSEEKVEFISDSISLYEGSVYSECRVEIDPTVLAEALKRGTPDSESHIAFFLDMFMEARVYNYALLFALVLRRVDSIVTAIQSDPSSEMLSILMAIDCWGHQESGGYSLFLQSLKPLITPLFPPSANDLKLKPLVKISSFSSLNSSNSALHSQDKEHANHSFRGSARELSGAKRLNENSESMFHLENNVNHLSVNEVDQGSCNIS